MNLSNGRARAAVARFVPKVPRALMAPLAVGLLVAAVATPTQAMRHLRLLRSMPAADTVLTASPGAISLWLSEPTNAAVSKITLQSVGGGMVPLGKLTRESEATAPLVAKVPSLLAPGAYTVTWKTMSKDGHVVDGAFDFTIRAAN